MNEQIEQQQVSFEITDDPIILRLIIIDMVKALRETKTPSREKSLAITKLQEAQFWLMQHSAES